MIDLYLGHNEVCYGRTDDGKVLLRKAGAHLPDSVALHSKIQLFKSDISHEHQCGFFRKNPH